MNLDSRLRRLEVLKSGTSAPIISVIKQEPGETVEDADKRHPVVPQNHRGPVLMVTLKRYAQ